MSGFRGTFGNIRQEVETLFRKPEEDNLYFFLYYIFFLKNTKVAPEGKAVEEIEHFMKLKQRQSCRPNPQTDVSAVKPYVRDQPSPRRSVTITQTYKHEAATVASKSWINLQTETRRRRERTRRTFLRSTCP